MFLVLFTKKYQTVKCKDSIKFPPPRRAKPMDFHGLFSQK